MASSEVRRRAHNNLVYLETKQRWTNLANVWPPADLKKPVLQLPEGDALRKTLAPLVYAYFVKLLARTTVFRNLRADVQALHAERLISYGKLTDINDLISSYEQQLWATMISILTEWRYLPTGGGTSVVLIKSIDDLAEALLETDRILRRIQESLTPTIQALQKDVELRTRECQADYQQKNVCDPWSCVLDRPWFGTPSCRSLKR